PAVECRHRDSRHRQPVARHLCENVEVALDQRRFGDDRDRVAKIAQYFEDRPGAAELALDRLIGIGVAAECDWAAHIALLAQLDSEQFCSLRLVKEPALEIEPRRQAEIGMARPGIAIDAA